MTGTFGAPFMGFMDISELFEEREGAAEIRYEHAAVLFRSLVGLRKPALMREDRKMLSAAIYHRFNAAFIRLSPYWRENISCNIGCLMAFFTVR